MQKCLFAVLAFYLLAFSESPAATVAAFEEKGKLVCDEARAVKSAKTVTVDYCSGERGCDFKVRPDNETSGGKSGRWLITVSLIHSFAPDGTPKFMPEGFRFVRVERIFCGVVGILAHEGEQVIPPNASGKVMCEERGGTWGRFGLLLRDECNLPAKDARKPCNDGTECSTGICVALNESDSPSPRLIYRGACYPRTIPRGDCIRMVVNGLAETRSLCVD